MSGWVGGAVIGHRPRFTFWLTFFQSCMLPLFFSGLLSYLVGMKRRTSRCVTCKRDNSHFLRYVMSPSTSEVYLLVNFFIPRHTIVAGYYGFMLDVRSSVHFEFRMITRVNINGFSPNFVCALILWRSGLGLLMGKFHQIFTELSA